MKDINGCKYILERIAVMGSAAASEVGSHLAGCAACSAAFQEEIALEQRLLPPAEQLVPVHLKYAILQAAQKQRQHSLLTTFFPAFRLVFRTLVVLVVVVSGFWLGLQMAAGDGESRAGDFDVSSAGAYQLSTTPADPTNLGQVYISVLQEGDHVQ